MHPSYVGRRERYELLTMNCTEVYLKGVKGIQLKKHISTHTTETFLSLGYSITPLLYPLPSHVQLLQTQKVNAEVEGYGGFLGFLYLIIHHKHHVDQEI